MIRFLFLHLLESTFFCLLLSGLAYGLRKGAAARHAVLLLGVTKFAIPTVLLARTGEQIASFWPAGSWLALLTYKLTRLFAFLQDSFPLAWQTELLAIWALGVVVLVAMWIVRLQQSKATLTAPSREEALVFEQCRRLLGVRSSVSLGLSKDLIEPALRGIWRPTVTVPVALFEKLTEAEFQTVLLHELAHAQRFDNVTSMFVHALACLFWFHPLLWFMERRLALEREQACDETVLVCGMTPDVYVRGILKVCQFQICGGAGVSGMTGGDLRERLALILAGPLPVNLLCVPWILVAGLAILMTLVPVAGGYCEQCAFGGGKSSSEAGAALRCKTPASCPQIAR